MKKGYTLIELIITVTLIVILAALSVIAFTKLKAKARLSRVSDELAGIAISTTQYAQDNDNQFPADTSRSVPPGLEKYLAGGIWPKSTWPHGVFDYDNWTTLNGQPTPQIIQITYRLCDLNDPISYCKDSTLFPHFTRNSGIYYCIQGACVPSQSAPMDPGYCVNCKPKEVNPPL